MNVNAKILYTAYRMAADTPEQEDVSCHLQAAADACGHIWADGEMQAYREFLGQHTMELAGGFRMGENAFAATVTACAAADASAAEVSSADCIDERG